MNQTRTELSQCFRGIRPIQRMPVSMPHLPLTSQDFRVDMDTDCLERYTEALSMFTSTSPSTSSLSPMISLSSSLSSPTESKTFTSSTSSLSSPSIVSPSSSPSSESPLKSNIQGSDIEKNLSKTLVHEIVTSALERMSTFEPLLPKLLDDSGFNLFLSLTPCLCCIKYVSAALCNLCQSLYGVRLTRPKLLNHKNVDKIVLILSSFLKLPLFPSRFLPIPSTPSISSTPSSLDSSDSSSILPISCYNALLGTILGLVRLNKGKQLFEQTEIMQFVFICASNKKEPKVVESATTKISDLSPQKGIGVRGGSGCKNLDCEHESHNSSNHLHFKPISAKTERHLAVSILCELARSSDLDLRVSFLCDKFIIQDDEISCKIKNDTKIPWSSNREKITSTSTSETFSTTLTSKATSSLKFALSPCLITSLINVLNSTLEDDEEEEVRVSTLLALQSLYLTDTKKFELLFQMFDYPKHRTWKQTLIQCLGSISNSQLRIDVMEQILGSGDEYVELDLEEEGI